MDNSKKLYAIDFMIDNNGKILVGGTFTKKIIKLN